MNEKLTFTGGEPNINFDDLNRNNKANKSALINALRAYGDNYIIQGVTGTTSITAGYVMLDGEILQVDAHSKTGTHFVKVTTYDSAGDKIFNDLTPRQTWAKHRATITAGSGSLAYSGAQRMGDIIATLLRATTSAAATTALAGIVEKATLAELFAGTADKYIDAATLQTLTATTSRAGIQENATSAEAMAFNASDRTITPIALSGPMGGLLIKRLDIGDWNMDTDQDKPVTHGIANYKKITSINAIIFSDSGLPLSYDINRADSSGVLSGWISSFSSTTIVLTRRTGGLFDSASFNSTSYNRGYITILYLP